MADHFGIPQLKEYLAKMGLRLANVDLEQEIIELAFHGNHGQWRMIIGIQQSGEVRKLMLIAPHIAAVTKKKRLECLEALMAVNYRIAMGKFGLDLDDGEVRLEEAIPLADDSVTFEQFQLALGAMMQTVAMYHSLLPRIVYGDLSVLDALNVCEQEFLQEINETEQKDMTTDETMLEQPTEPEGPTELNVNDVLAEITRMLEEHTE
ncbi:MAG TPA: hypothetical protein DDW33_11700 [Ktedonobacter sp.]|nr:hypothetical protein [Ktedonobacter sp.]HBE26338.1 hypothetical protein [Ktedonobacter sp.]HCF87565.1 hypothetical protein [Ktedonobacter sp.]HCP75113.1 hypothetical protein [Ktedonobacter sp.]